MKIIRFIVIPFFLTSFIPVGAGNSAPAVQANSLHAADGGQQMFRVPGIWLMFVFAGLAQLVEQLICNQSVIGSSPISSSKRVCTYIVKYGCKG